MTKSCNTCGTTKSLQDFWKYAKSKDGYKNHCRSCMSASRKNYYERNREREIAASNLYNSINRKEMLTRKRKYKKLNPGRCAEENMRRKATKTQATPPWLTFSHITEMRAIYTSCPKGHHVDHIIPLRGKHICGLHVPWNLQILIAEDNIRKGNRITVEGL
jgi:hypothetical protein